jgi:hypothetical protein
MGPKFEQTCSSKLAIPKATFRRDMLCPTVPARCPSSPTRWS